MFFLIYLAFSTTEEVINCSDAQPHQMLCQEQSDCALDQPVDLTCVVFHSTICAGPRLFVKKNVSCRYCYQLPIDSIQCDILTDCNPSLSFFQTRCHPLDFCMGPSIFERRSKCMKSQKSQKTAFLLSLFFGVVAADRFYLGHYVTAVFKMLTFGGLGIAYMVDMFLILFGYLGPADGGVFPERL
ncbi:TM2 domain containing protein [Tritrichomonas foetus]|uniref:TM2 domain containing protein n=1 Tax=Tritrichomonas foetus TaxID=1144522 RepID=A0A1J4J9I6_9EUKA|nr:TM2 domain containing protein [Tritrichomonas foetus]|eukprot:OHS93900.1 TM2 domain containing protein [Tritrichomonas foetus]